MSTFLPARVNETRSPLSRPDGIPARAATVCFQNWLAGLGLVWTETPVVLFGVAGSGAGAEAVDTFHGVSFADSGRGVSRASAALIAAPWSL